MDINFFVEILMIAFLIIGLLLLPFPRKARFYAHIGRLGLILGFLAMLAEKGYAYSGSTCCSAWHSILNQLLYGYPLWFSLLGVTVLLPFTGLFYANIAKKENRYSFLCTFYLAVSLALVPFIKALWGEGVVLSLSYVGAIFSIMPLSAIGSYLIWVPNDFFYAAEIEVSVPKEQLFAYITDYKTWELFYPSTITARPLSDAPIKKGDMLIEKYWGYSGFHVLLHRVTDFLPPKKIEWTGTCIGGGFLPSRFQEVLNSTIGRFTYTLVEKKKGKVVWRRECFFNCKSPKWFIRFLYKLYMVLFSIELLKNIKLHQALCKERLEKDTIEGFIV